MMKVSYLGYVFSVERQLNYSSGGEIYLLLKPIVGVKYPKRILKMACHYPIASAVCVEVEPEVLLTTEKCDVR
jgi:hypothetical protein